ncbi:MAG: hypothetical protein JOZ56_05920 [Actinobacteria bacterium]|nr:hypothetical protein [Actinomycetota bacterium]MBV8562610.1 hypothetical protein [Actinomycetota bacterium]
MAAYANLDLPNPFKASWPLLALAALAAALEIDPRLPWLLGAVGAISFGVAALVRAVAAERELNEVRRTADRLIVYAPRTRDATALVLWRAEELTQREERAKLKRELERTIRQLSPDRLPGSSPIRRVAARRHVDLLRALAQRVGDGDPVAARGILLTRQLLRDPASPLYAEGSEPLLARALTRALGALEP